MIEDSWKLKNKEKRNGTNRFKNKSEDDGKASIVSSDNSDNGDVLIIFAGCVSMNSEWVLDSACSYHVCINNDWFSTYEPVQNGGVVQMGDNTPCVALDQLRLRCMMVRHAH
jgi:hypothetical protein